MWARAAVVLISLGLVSSASASALAASPPRAQTEYGIVEGFVDSSSGSSCFFGIPFASPPTGSLRWHAPVPPRPWSPGVLSTKEYGFTCLQQGLKDNSTASEDCLTINVISPNSSVSQGNLLPVAMFIYGGGFIHGSSADPLYDGRDFIATAIDSGSPVVFVSFNYRLDVLGFLALETGEGTGMNYGLLDQVLALKFVRDNIRAFGGDPSKVTLWGESAGAMSVYYQMVNPLSGGLFSKAILESGIYFPVPLLTRKQALNQSLLVGSTLGCSHQSQEAMVACLRGKEAWEVIYALKDNDLFFFGTGATWGPRIDGFSLVESPGITFAQKKNHPLDAVLIGNTAQEARTFVYPVFPHGMTRKEYEAGLLTAMKGSPLSLLIDIEQKYASMNGSLEEKFSAIITDGDLQCPTRWLMTEFSKQGTTLFEYLFAFPYFGPEIKAGHGSDLAFNFGHSEFPPTKLTPTEEALSQRMRTYWARFVATGNPGAWPAYTTEQQELIVLNAQDSMTNHFKEELCEWWIRLLEHAFAKIQSPL